MCNLHRDVIYVGVTNNLERRVLEHKNESNPNSFTSKYRCFYLVYYQTFTDIKDAIAEEKRIKSGNRKNKIKLIETMNPEWKDLSEELFI